VENPYHHPFEKPYSVNTKDIKILRFEIYNLVMASAGHQGMGIDYDDEKPNAILLIERLHYELAEAELSKKLLQLAISTRTLDDVFSNSYSDEIRKAYVEGRKTIDDASDLGNYYEPKKDEKRDLGIRNICNKIVHAKDIRPVYDSNDDRDSAYAEWGMTGVIELKGKDKNEEWLIDIYVPSFLDAVIELITLTEILNGDQR